MRTHLLFTYLLSTLLVGCATPALTIQEPTEQQLIEARQHLNMDPPTDTRAPDAKPDPKTMFESTAIRVANAAQRVCERVAAHLEIGRCSAAWTMPILYTEDEVNAFADEHDRIGVFTGLLHHIPIESELAAVLAHEYSHVMLDHVDKKGDNALAGLIIASVLGGVVAGASGVPLDSRTLDTYQRLGIMAGSRAYSPEMELEADRLAVYILQEARYPGLAMRDALVRLHHLKTSPGTSGASVGRVGFLETHPSDDRRIAHILSVIRDVAAGKPLTMK